MRMTLLLSASLAVLLMASGCASKTNQSETAETETAKATSPPIGEGQATADIVPGSYEDWCDEHQVPETQCTRCDPSLVPAFQAANDWDAEHGLPMSQCTIHNPNLKIVRPPQPEGK
jgi:hypothetical protein